MTSQVRRWLFLATVVSIMLTAIVACGDRAQPQIQSDTLPTTQAAQTNIALTNAPPTAGPSPTPTQTSTPYMTVTPLPDTDPEAVIATIGDREISLADYQARVRYERWLPLYALNRNIDVLGTRILDLTLPENSNTVALLRTMNEDPRAFGFQVLNVMLIEQVVLQEAAELDLEIIQTFYDARIAARIGVELGRNGVRPPRWDEAYDIFIADMELYTGMSEGDFLEIMRALTFYEQLGEIVGDQAPIENFAVGELPTSITVQDITLNTQEDAIEVAGLLQDGASITALARDYGVIDRVEQSRTVTRGTEGFSETVIDAIFDASIGDAIGPFPISEGWYVAIILDEELDVLEPADIAEIQEDFYADWINAQIDDPEFVTTDELWRDFVPVDPLPRDISPMLRDENFIVPTDPFLAQGITSTPAPISDFLE